MKKSVKSKISTLLLIGSTLLMSNHGISQIVPFDQLIANVGNGGAYNKSIEWNTSMWDAGFGHKIYSDDYNGKTYLKFAARHNSSRWSDMMTLTSQGHVGIGTASPSVALSVEGEENQTTLGLNTVSAIRIANKYANYFGRRSELQFGLDQSPNLAVIAAEYTGWGGPSDLAGDLVFGTNPLQLNSVVERMRITNNGNIGIGTTAPSAKLSVYAGAISSPAVNTELDLVNFGGHVGNSTRLGVSLFKTGPENNWNNAALLLGYDVDVTKRAGGFISMLNGNVGIGTVNPGYKLDVIGTIRAREVKVNLGGADFVFEDGYKLMPLNDLEKFVKQNKHLPEIAPAKEMQEKGSDLGGLSIQLLQKIEELTLHAIEQNKKLELQNNKLEQQNKEVEELILHAIGQNKKVEELTLHVIEQNKEINLLKEKMRKLEQK